MRQRKASKSVSMNRRVFKEGKVRMGRVSRFTNPSDVIATRSSVSSASCGEAVDNFKRCRASKVMFHMRIDFRLGKLVGPFNGSHLLKHGTMFNAGGMPK